MVILRHETSYLLLKRNKEPFVGHYVPVGGKIEPYESPLKAAIRETFEETGLVITQPKFCGVLVESSPIKYNWIVFIYLADIDRVPPPPCPEGVLEWIEHDAILSVPTPETDWHIYNYVLDNKPFMFDAEYDEHLNLVRMVEEFENQQVH
ncbi:MAG: NUDIX domain-containing protein [Saprospiraceae bacterium]|nr:NUDIX domain-containing protein [Saprospiraceae bacterium]